MGWLVVRLRCWSCPDQIRVDVVCFVGPGYFVVMGVKSD